MIRPLQRFWRAAAFLTRLPAPAPAFEGGPHPLGNDSGAFAPVGLLAALPSALALCALSWLGLQPISAAFLAILLLVALTGALHEDGLADTADGLFGHASRERALEIMKDSRIGTYGALALIGSVGARALLLADITAHDPRLAALALLAAAGASRGAMAWVWSSLPPARPGGLSSRMEAPSPAAGRGAALGALLVALCGGALTAGAPGAALPALLAGTGLWLLRRFLLRRLGGATGDTLGAAQQIGETLLLLGFSLAMGGR